MRHFILFNTLILSVILASACSLLPFPAATPVPVPTATPLVLATPTTAPLPTAAPTVAAPTMVITPTVVVTPTIPVPPPTPVGSVGGTPSPKRISFPAGGTTAFVQGNLAPGYIDRYVLRALAGQTMSLNLVMAQGMAILYVYGPDGTVLVPIASNATNWSGRLPATQDYVIEIRSTSTAASNYALQVTIPPLTTTPQSTPRRITFQPGATSATIQGNTATPGSDRFVLRVQAGQTMTATLTSAQNNVILIIYGADGAVLISDHAGATTWTGQVPSTQDYLIDTRSVGSSVVPFTLKVTIPPLANVPPTAAAPRRITFPAGGTSASLQGNLGANGIDRYVLRVLAGQNMTVTVTSSTPGATLLLAINGADGNVLKSSGAGGPNWSGPVPSTQDYFLTVSTATGAPAAYSLQVAIPPP